MEICFSYYALLLHSYSSRQSRVMPYAPAPDFVMLFLRCWESRFVFPNIPLCSIPTLPVDLKSCHMPLQRTLSCFFEVSGMEICIRKYALSCFSYSSRRSRAMPFAPVAYFVLLFWVPGTERRGDSYFRYSLSLFSKRNNL